MNVRMERLWAIARAGLLRVDAWILRTLPPDLDLEAQHRARVLVALVAVFDAAMVLTVPFDAANHAWRAVMIQLGWGSIVATALILALRRGRIAAMGHFVSAVLVLNLGLIADEKGGLVATECAWQCAAIIFSTLVVGPRGSFVWTLVAMAELGIHARRFDPTSWHGRHVSFESVSDYAVDLGILYLATWGLAFAFDRARAQFFRRLEKRNAEMRRVLDHARDAFLTIDRDGRLGAERSRSADELLQKPAAGRLLWDVLADDPANAERAQFVEMGWEAVLDGFLPPEVALDQLPSRVAFGGRTLELRVTPIEEQERLEGALIVFHDATEKLARERAEQARREVLSVFEHVRRDPGEAAEFVSDMDRLVASVVRGVVAVTVKRDLHTIKGNAGLFGLESLATLCHEIEARTAQAERSLPSTDDRALLASAWETSSADLRKWTEELDGAELLAITRADLDEVRRQMSVLSFDRVDALITKLAFAPAKRVLDRLARQGAGLAMRLGYHVAFELDISPPSLRIDAERLRPLISALVHAIRNSLDHGFAGVEREGTIVLRAFERSKDLIVEVEDDGNGVAWDKVRAKAESEGLAAVTHADLVDALCHDGLSTADVATTMSGRGVGLSGLRQAARDLGGDLTVASEGKGTCVRVCVPIHAAASIQSVAPDRAA